MLYLLLLFTLLMSAEMLIMQVMQKLDIETSFFWLEVFLDAVIIASITTLAVRYLVKTNRLKIRQDLNF